MSAFAGDVYDDRVPDISDVDRPLSKHFIIACLQRVDDSPGNLFGSPCGIDEFLFDHFLDRFDIRRILQQEKVGFQDFQRFSFQMTALASLKGRAGASKRLIEETVFSFHLGLGNLLPFNGDRGMAIDFCPTPSDSFTDCHARKYPHISV